MFLLIAFRPGETLSIGGVHFQLNLHPPKLLLPGGGVLALTDIPVTPVPDVTVSLYKPMLEDAITLRFQAPKGVRILRHPAGETL